MNDCMVISYNTNLWRSRWHFTFLFSALLVKKNNLTELYLQYCEIDGGMTCELAEAMYGSSKLTVLELNGNPIQETGASALAGMLSSNSCLKQLDLTACVSMGASGATKLIDSLKHNSTLETLCLPEKYKGSTSEVEKRITWCSDMSTESVVDWRDRTVDSQHVRLLGKCSNCSMIVLLVLRFSLLSQVLFCPNHY